MKNKWHIGGVDKRMTGHGESETLVRVECPDIPCPVYVGDTHGNPVVQRMVAERIVSLLNLGVDNES